jgi:hypothetical protein
VAALGAINGVRQDCERGRPSEETRRHSLVPRVMFSARALVAAPQKADKAVITTSLMNMEFLRTRKSA